MTIPEAASLVLQSSVLSRGGDLFLLDMGEPVRIKDLAVQMVRLVAFLCVMLPIRVERSRLSHRAATG